MNRAPPRTGTPKPDPNTTPGDVQHLCSAVRAPERGVSPCLYVPRSSPCARRTMPRGAARKSCWAAELVSCGTTAPSLASPRPPVPGSLSHTLPRGGDRAEHGHGGTSGGRRRRGPPAASSRSAPLGGGKVICCVPWGGTHFSRAWLSDGTLLLLLPLPYMPAESSDCHAPVNPSQPPREQPRHHGDAATHTPHWPACRPGTPPGR